MSKRVMIIMVIGFICILAAFFINRHETLNPEPEEDNEPVEDPIEEEEEEPEKPAANVQKETAATGTTDGNKTE